jgi:hypothetical protein
MDPNPLGNQTAPSHTTTSTGYGIGNMKDISVRQIENGYHIRIRSTTSYRDKEYVAATVAEVIKVLTDTLNG